MNKTWSLMFAGVGGQGSLLMAELASLTAVRAGHDVKQSEVHGVSQRGGSVETHVRFGPKVHSPIITPGTADFVVALEKLEALRFAHYVEPQHGLILVNEFEIVPPSVSNAEALYPHESIDYLRGRGLRVFALPASRMARDLGDGRMANVVMLGVLSTFLPFPQETWEETLQARLPPRFLEGNLRAFRAGRQASREFVPQAAAAPIQPQTSPKSVKAES